MVNMLGTRYGKCKWLTVDKARIKSFRIMSWVAKLILQLIILDIEESFLEITSALRVLEYYSSFGIFESFVVRKIRPIRHSDYSNNSSFDVSPTPTTFLS